MEFIYCTLCVSNKCLPKGAEVTPGLASCNPHGGVNKVLKNGSQVLFLVRQMLEIPQDICCTFLADYGDPCSWMDFCDSCSALLQKGKLVFDQMMTLQTQFKTLQNQIKNQMTDIQMERKLDEGKRRVKQRIRSYICHDKGISSVRVANTICKEEKIDDDSSSDHDATESICLPEDDSFLYPDVVINECDEFEHQSEDMDPLGLPESGEENVNNDELEKIQGSEFIEIEQIKLEREFLPETSDGNFSAISISVNNEQCEAAISSTYIIPQIVKETNVNQNVLKKTHNKKYRCAFCGRHFKTNSHLKVHEKIHTGEKPFKCETCGKAFRVSNSLIEHQRRHTGEKPYKCNFCEKAFPAASELAQHTRRHTEDKPYKCRFCDKGCVGTSQLRVHERIHTGEKPFKCDTCGDAFANSSGLTQHLTSAHTGVKPYKCEMCGKDFALPGQLNWHKKAHAGGKPYKCKLCEKAFIHYHELTRHKKEHNT